MTIKPVVTSTQKRVSGSDPDKKDSHSHATHSGQVVVEQPNSLTQQTVVRNTSVHSHRNVVIDAQSPQRRGEVYDEITRHRRSPHKSSRPKRRDHFDHHHKRERVERERVERDKHSNIATNVSGKCHSPHVQSVSGSGSKVNSGSNGTVSVSVGGKSPENLSAIPVVLGCQSPKSQGVVSQAAADLLKAVEETYSGYNSGDEHLTPKEIVTPDEWQRRDEEFSKFMAGRGLIVKPVEEDGACLFRAISLQLYGDEEMHDVIRQHTMDYIYTNREFYSQFVTEDFNGYIKRKRRKDSHGNHIEIQAMSEMYNRPVEVYSYGPTPINIFNPDQLKNGYAPMRLSYQRASHYNAIIDPYNATVGVGLGLAGYKPDLQTKEAVRLSEQLEIEQTMFEDKLKTTDWEATNEVMEEQIARESYLQWCRENLQKSRTVASSSSTSATVTSAEVSSDAEASPSKYSVQRNFNSKSTSASTATATTNSSTTTSASFSPSFSALSQNFHSSHSYKKDVSGRDLGFDSDDTDISSTSSIGGSGSASPSRAIRAKKTKTHNAALRNGKKRRRDHSVATLAKSDIIKDLEAPSRKSPKRDSPSIVVAVQNTRALTPDAEQKPCTSKQSNSPKKNVTESKDISTEQPISSFYQELLEASYAADGFGQLNESEMLQRAIQMSTQDYIEDQKRKFYYGP